MAHYAKVNNGVVEKVIVADAEFFDTFVDSTPGQWIQCSYNTRGGVYYTPNTNDVGPDQSKALRYNYPGSGWKYNPEADAFYPPQAYPSWTLNTTTYLWEPPTPRPEGRYEWNESTLSWVQQENIILP